MARHISVITFLGALAFWANACCPTAWAEPGGTSGVSAPSSDAGVFESGLRTTYFDGGVGEGAWSHRAQAGYGFSDWFRSMLILRADQPNGFGVELRSMGLESVVDFTPTRAWPVHLGGLFEYKHGLNGAEEEIVFKLLAERRFETVTARVNLIAERAFSGASDDWVHGVSGRLMWRASAAAGFGAEAFSEAGAHYAGPRVELKAGTATLSFAGLAGFEDAQADAQLRLALEFEH